MTLTLLVYQPPGSESVPLGVSVIEPVVVGSGSGVEVAPLVRAVAAVAGGVARLGEELDDACR